MASSGFFPSGSLDDPGEGISCYTVEETQCYTEVDITTQTKKPVTQLNSLSIGEYLRVEPSSPKNGGLQYKGNPTIIKCFEDDAGKRCFKCLHVVVVANEKKKIKQQLCGKEWLAIASEVNIGTIRSHCRNQINHWVSVKEIPKRKKGSISTFFAKKQKSKDSTIEGSMNPRNNGQQVQGATAFSSTETSPLEVSTAPYSSIAAAPIATNNVVDIESTNNLIQIEHVLCHGLDYNELPNMDTPPGYIFLRDYPVSLHSPDVLTKYGSGRGNLMPLINWNFDSNGNFHAAQCMSIIVRNKNNKHEVENTTNHIGKSSCTACINLQFNQSLRKIMKQSIQQCYPPQLPDSLVPASALSNRLISTRQKKHDLELDILNHIRKCNRLSNQTNNHSRLMLLLQTNDVPGIRRLLTVHCRNGGSIKGFTEKCQLAASWKRVGHGTCRRGFIQRGKYEDSTYDPDARKALLMTVLMNKLGCNKLVHTYNVLHGGVSQTTARRHMNGYKTVPNFKIGLSSSITSFEQEGLKAIEKNMEGIFGNGEIMKFLPSHPVIVSLHADGVNIDERLSLDTSVLPHQMVGCCRHIDNTNFIDYEDVERIQNGLNTTFHYASEAEVFAIGLNHGSCTSLIPIAISGTCKKDNFVGESTDTVYEIVSTIVDKFHEMQLHKLIGPLATINSDGAAHFRKACGKKLSVDIPKNVRAFFLSPTGTSRCLLFNLVGGKFGTTMGCDNDHLGKRYRARMKSARGLLVGKISFTKVDIVELLSTAGIVTTADEADKLFNPDDLMCVLETSKALHAVGQLGSIPFFDFPLAWQAIPANRTIYLALRLLGKVSKLMCTLIVGHKGELDATLGHLSVSEYLTVCSTLAHMLFFMFRQNKTEFIPAQHYRNWQDTIKNMFLAVAVAKANGVEHFYWFLNTNKRLEQLFGICRSMRSGNLNFDILDLRDRLADSAVVQWIYA